MDTLSERMAVLDQDGWSAQLEVVGGGIHCLACGEVSAPEACAVERVERFEGVSDPGDESILFALTPSCGHRGTLVAVYGMEASRDVVDVVGRLGDGPRHAR